MALTTEAFADAHSLFRCSRLTLSTETLIHSTKEVNGIDLTMAGKDDYDNTSVLCQ